MTTPPASTITGGTLSSMPPPKTYTPAALASSMTACESSDTCGSSSAVTRIAELGKEMRYFVMAGPLRP